MHLQKHESLKLGTVLYIAAVFDKGLDEYREKQQKLEIGDLEDGRAALTTLALMRNRGKRNRWAIMILVPMLTTNLTALSITPEILSLIAQIDEFKGDWRAFPRIAPEQLSSLRRVATIESVASSTRTEGARLTDREVEKLAGNIRLEAFYDT